MTNSSISRWTPKTKYWYLAPMTACWIPNYEFIAKFCIFKRSLMHFKEIILRYCSNEESCDHSLCENQSSIYLEHAYPETVAYKPRKSAGLHTLISLLNGWSLDRLLHFRWIHIPAESFPKFSFVLFYIVHRKIFSNKFRAQKFLN